MRRPSQQIPERLLVGRHQAREAEAHHLQSGNRRSLEQALSTWRFLHDSPRWDDLPLAFRLSVLNGAGRTYLRRYWTSGQIDDLDAGLRAWQEALLLVPLGEDRSGYLNNLGIGFNTRYERTGELDNLERSIRSFEEAVADVDPESPDAAGFLSHLGIAYRIRYERSGNLDDLDHALDLAETAVSRTPQRSPDLPARLGSRGLARQARYGRSGAFADLEGACRDFEQAVEQTPPGVPTLPLRLSNLGTAWGQRYERTGDLEDLERSKEAFERSVLATPPGSLPLAGTLNNLGLSLGHLYEHTHDAALLDRAVETFGAAAACQPPDAHYSSRYLLGLANVLLRRFELSSVSDDLEEAVRLLERTFASFSPEDPLHAVAGSHLSEALSRRFGLTKDPEDLEAALRRGHGAVSASVDNPQRPRLLAAFAAVLLVAHEHGRADRADVLRAYRQAITEGFESAVEVSLEAACFLGDWAFRSHHEDDAADAYRSAFLALGRLLDVLPVRPAREVWLRKVQGMTARAAYALARLGDLPGAVAAFEDGHARLLTEASVHRRTALEALHGAHPDLHGRYFRTSERLAVLEQEALRADPASRRVRVAEIRGERSALEAILDEIRHRPGFERFLKTSSLDEAQDLLARSSPRKALVYLAATEAGSVAVLLTVKTAETVWMEATFDEILALLQSHRLDAGTAPPGAPPSLRPLFQALPLLGGRLTEPVADRLRALDVEEVVLVPIGLLAALPLHALLDAWPVSFVPNAHSLDAACGELERRCGPPYLLGVADPDGGARPLAGTAVELEEAESFFAEGARTLYGADARRSALLDGIGEATYLHLACHGRFDAGAPLDSRLELHGSDGLSLRDVLLGEARPRRARLVVLSACESALSDARGLPDELVGLPAGFLQAGVPGVVGTLWPVEDLSTALLMRRFYAHHLGEGKTPTQALAAAQLWLREVTVGELVDVLRAYRHESGISARRKAFAARALVSVRTQADTAKPYYHPYYWAAFVMVGV